MGASEDITAAENALRELIESVLAPALGPNWIEASGLTVDRLGVLRERLAAETSRRTAGRVEQRLIYYSDIFDLRAILIDKHWERFKACLDDKKASVQDLIRLEEFRNAQMHGRHLLPHEQALTTGISGEFRNKVALYRSERGPSREYFPRIELVRDSFGNVRHGHGTTGEASDTGIILHPGDDVHFEMQAWDPDNVPFTWTVTLWTDGRPMLDRANATEFTWLVMPAHINDPQRIVFTLRSARTYHREHDFDDKVILAYQVLPSSD